jgi:phage-related protein
VAAVEALLLAVLRLDPENKELGDGELKTQAMAVIAEAEGGIASNVTNATGHMTSGVTSGVASVRDWTNSIASDMTNAVGGIASNVTNATGHMTSGVTVTSGVVSVRDWTNSIASDMTNAVGDIASNMTNATGHMTSGVTSGVASVRDWTNSIASDMTNAVGGIASNVTNATGHVTNFKDDEDAMKKEATLMVAGAAEPLHEGKQTQSKVHPWKVKRASMTMQTAAASATSHRLSVTSGNEADDASAPVLAKSTGKNQ